MSAQNLVRTGEVHDLYYADAANQLIQAIPVEYDTRFTSDFSNKASGVSVFTIPPNMGVRHVLIVLGYSANDISGQLGARALERGWGYKALAQGISFRIGGSSQYFLNGAQLLARNLRLCRTQSQRDAILSLGGNECKTAADFTVDQFAYIPVSIWCAPGEDELQLPLPTDLLSQQVQITAQLSPQSQIFTDPLTAVGSPVDVGLPSGFSTAFFQIEQLVMNDRGMAMANSGKDMANAIYTMPLPTFDQQEVLVQVAPGGLSQSLVLTGFRAGQVKKLQIWLTKNDDTANTLAWYAPKSVQALYAGLIYANYTNGSSKIWNLLDGTAPAAVNQSLLSNGGGLATAWTSTPVLSQWAELPFGQPSGSDYEADIYTRGKEITNGIINLQITAPDADAYTLHVVYVYNCSVAFSRGTADLVF